MPTVEPGSASPRTRGRLSSAGEAGEAAGMCAGGGGGERGVGGGGAGGSLPGRYPIVFEHSETPVRLVWVAEKLVVEPGCTAPWMPEFSRSEGVPVATSGPPRRGAASGAGG